MTKLIATIISRTFEPVILWFLITLLAISRSGLSRASSIILITTISAIIISVVGLLIWSVKTKRVTNWDLGNRKQRIKAMAWFLLFVFICLIVVDLIGNRMMLWVFIFYTLWFIGFFLITIFKKISGHVGMLTLAIGVLIYWYGWNLWPLFFLVPVLGWARIVRRDHTTSEVVLGFLYSLIFLLISYNFIK